MKNSKNKADDFVFPSKTARPTTSTPVLKPVDSQNSFVNLERDPEPHHDQTIEIPTLKPLSLVFLKIKDNYREQLKMLIDKFPNLKYKSSGDYLRLKIDSHEVYRNLIHFMSG
ncbi:hypothetical protein TNCV_965791 [Trichonephila clavipes]|nr:hypothetical protein TNCV_965791 [Trichonephila clavipes]